MKKVRVMLAVILTFSLAVCACLAAALGAGAATDLRPGDPAAESADPAESEYDVFSDPNVLWGGEESTVGDDMLLPGEVACSYRMIELLEQADEQNLIAFRVLTNSDGGGYPVRTDRLVIYEELAQCEELSYWLDHADSGEACGQMWMAVVTFVYEHVHEVEEEMGRIEQEIQSSLTKEREVESFTGDDWDALRQEAKELAMEREDYRALYEVSSYYTSMEREFGDSMDLQLAEAIRNRFIGMGFTPVYEFDFDEAMSCEGAERYAWEEKAVTFVATAAQISQIEDMIEEPECYRIMLAGNDDSAWPD